MLQNNSPSGTHLLDHPVPHHHGSTIICVITSDGRLSTIEDGLLCENFHSRQIIIAITKDSRMPSNVERRVILVN